MLAMRERDQSPGQCAPNDCLHRAVEYTMSPRASYGPMHGMEGCMQMTHRGEKEVLVQLSGPAICPLHKIIRTRR